MPWPKQQYFSRAAVVEAFVSLFDTEIFVAVTEHTVPGMRSTCRHEVMATTKLSAGARHSTINEASSTFIIGLYRHAHWLESMMARCVNLSFQR